MLDLLGSRQDGFDTASLNSSVLLLDKFTRVMKIAAEKDGIKAKKGDS